MTCQLESNETCTLVNAKRKINNQFWSCEGTSLEAVEIRTCGVSVPAVVARQQPAPCLPTSLWFHSKLFLFSKSNPPLQGICKCTGHGVSRGPCGKYQVSLNVPDRRSTRHAVSRISLNIPGNISQYSCHNIGRPHGPPPRHWKIQMNHHASRSVSCTVRSTYENLYDHHSHITYLENHDAELPRSRTKRLGTRSSSASIFFSLGFTAPPK